jgi:transcriptional regulator with XRE-family HTH domain
MTNFKKARIDKELSQKEIAVALQVAQPTVSAWEAGTKTPAGKNLKKLSGLLGCSTDYLLEHGDDLSMQRERPGEVDELTEQQLTPEQERSIIRYVRLLPLNMQLATVEMLREAVEAIGAQDESPKDL